MLWAPSIDRMSSSSLIWTAMPSRFWLFWIRNTIKNVTIVVPVLMTSCHVSLKWKSGPVTPHTMTINTARMNAYDEPALRLAQFANLTKKDDFSIATACFLHGNASNPFGWRRGDVVSAADASAYAGRGVGDMTAEYHAWYGSAAVMM